MDSIRVPMRCPRALGSTRFIKILSEYSDDVSHRVFAGCNYEDAGKVCAECRMLMQNLLDSNPDESPASLALICGSRLCSSAQN